MPSREEAEEAAERVAARLHDRKPQDSILRLLLTIAAEELKIHRLHLEEKKRQAMSETPNNDKQNTRKEKSKSPRRRKSPSSRRARKHDHRSETPHPEHSEPDDPHSHVMMSGGRGSEPPSPAPSTSPQPRRRRRRKSPLGDPPTYRPKLGPTLGFASHVRACIEYEAKRLEREKHRKARRERKQSSGRRDVEQERESPGSRGGRRKRLDREGSVSYSRSEVRARKSTDSSRDIDDYENSGSHDPGPGRYDADRYGRRRYSRNSYGSRGSSSGRHGRASSPSEGFGHESPGRYRQHGHGDTRSGHRRHQRGNRGSFTDGEGHLTSRQNSSESMQAVVYESNQHALEVEEMEEEQTRGMDQPPSCQSEKGDSPTRRADRNDGPSWSFGSLLSNASY